MTQNLYTIDDLANLPPPKWLLKNMLPDSGIAFVYGQPNHGKTTTLTAMICEIVSEKQLKTVYTPTEGILGLSGRILGWQTVHKSDLSDLMLSAPSPNICNASDFSEYCDLLDKTKPRIVVLDTFSGIAIGADENAAKDMNLIMSRLRELVVKLECLIIVVHHSGKDITHGLRGSSVLLAAADAVLRVSKNENVVTVECQKQRDGITGQRLFYELKEVEYESQQGVTSTVVAHRTSQQQKVSARSIFVNVVERLQPVSPEAALKEFLIESSDAKFKDPQQNFRTELNRLRKQKVVIQDTNGNIKLHEKDLDEQMDFNEQASAP
jgi:hypothetical protein